MSLQHYYSRLTSPYDNFAQIKWELWIECWGQYDMLCAFPNAELKEFVIKIIMRPMMHKIIHFWFPYRKRRFYIKFTFVVINLVLRTHNQLCRNRNLDIYFQLCCFPWMGSNINVYKTKLENNGKDSNAAGMIFFVCGTFRKLIKDKIKMKYYPNKYPFNLPQK